MQNNYLAEYKNKNHDLKRPIMLFQEGPHEIYWLGIPEHTAFRSNTYLIKSEDQTIIIDPGHRAYFNEVRDRVAQVTLPEKVHGLVLCHQDPDVAASITDWLEVNPNLKIYTSPRTQVLLPYYGSSDYEWHDIVDIPKLAMNSGKTIQFIEAPFLHFPGAFVTYDATSQFLFSGDIWAAIQLGWSLVVEDFEEHVSYLDLFHLDYMASGIACRGFIERIESLAISAILPQHGSIIEESNIQAAIDYVHNLECGTDIVYAHLTEQ